MKTLMIAAAMASLCGVSALAAPVYATDVVWSGGGVSDGVASGRRSDIDNALGAPDEAFLSLGSGGWAVLSFGVEFSGPARLWEITWNCRVASSGYCAGYVENAEILTASSFNGADLAGFVSQGAMKNGEGQGGGVFSLTGGPFRYIALRDFGSVGDGFEIDAVQVNAAPASSAVPLPLSAAMLAAGVAGVAAVGRRRRG